ncbi:DNA-3-methyladenine glycosylase family protein [Bacillus fonticola]|uniref:DNA-3-methyladenine glycosylase family protein n=1 Tax=Bacillus fonticola TaxID=2728853 RepID=UPI001474316E|nr:DNA-3-methyladenine glycosylase [Bacillus fonticola]
MFETHVTPQPPYDWKQVLYRLQLDPLYEIDIEAQSLKLPVLFEGGYEIVTIRGLGAIEAPQLHLSSSSELTDALMEECARVLGFRKPLQSIFDYFQETELAGLFQAHRGTPIVLDMGVFPSLAKCIIHQQLNLKFAFTLTTRFVQTFGTQKEGVWCYPTPAQLAEVTVEDLRALQFSTRKAEYVLSIAKAFAEERFTEQMFLDSSDEHVYDLLIKERGIGPWTIQNVLMFALGRENLFPFADIGLQNALKQWYGLETKPALAWMEEKVVQWEPYRSYAALYLWRSIE